MELELIPFETAIKNCLDEIAQEDKAFAKTYAKPNKSIKECCKYIMQEVEKNRNGQRGVACKSEIVLGLAMHYYDEDDIKATGPTTSVGTAVAESPKKTTKPKAKAQAKPKVEKTAAPEPLEEESDDLEIPLF